MADFDYALRNRSERYVYEVLNTDLDRIGVMSGVEGCSLEWSIYNTIRGGGSLSVETQEKVEWQKVLIRPWIVTENASGSDAVPLMTAYCRIPEELVTVHGRSVQLELHDRMLLLDERKLSTSYSIPAGTFLTTSLRQIFLMLGIKQFTITDSPVMARNAMVWDPVAASGESISWLRVLNDILESIGYSAVYADARGWFRCEPYVEPGSRIPSWRLADDGAGTSQRYQGGVTIRSSVFESYNEWVLYSRSDGENAPLTAYAVNDDPSHPYSTVSTGLVRTDRRTDVDAASQAVLQGIADRAKAEAMADQRTFTMKARYFPAEEGDVIEIVNTPAGISTRASLSARSLDCKPGGKMTMTLREV